MNITLLSYLPEKSDIKLRIEIPSDLLFCREIKRKYSRISIMGNMKPRFDLIFIIKTLRISLSVRIKNPKY
jgi:hypothetical protein